MTRLRTDGWIWAFKPHSGMSDEDVEQWMVEGEYSADSIALNWEKFILLGDRVQWFRAEAEMERWREEWEIKQADFLRCIRSFAKMSSVWQVIASNTVEAGKCAYAKHKSAVFKEMEKHARTLFNDAGYGHLIDHLLDNNEGKILADYVLLERSDPRYIIPQLITEVWMSAASVEHF